MSIFSKIIKIDSSDDDYDFSELYDAIKTSDLDTVKDIIKKNKKLLYEKDEYGFTVIHAVASTDDEEVANFVLKRRNDVNIKNNDGIAALHNVMYPEIAKILIGSGADVNIIDNDGNTPLHIQASDGEERFDVIEILLAHGADKSVKNKRGQRAYDIAISREDKDNAKILK